MTTSNDSSKQLNETVEQASEYAREAADRVREAAAELPSNVREMGQRVKSQLDEIDVDETTIPDAFRKVPKVISPRVHKWLDIAVSSYFVGLGIWCAVRGKGGAAVAAFINGGMVAGVTMYTDYDGDGVKPINFKLHGTLDAVQATTAALGPVLHGFADEPEAKYFWGQAVNEVGVISMTDWDAGMPRGRRRRVA